ncbi:MAG: endonuclease III [Bacteroidales bacterium]|nr:endonuclease III [Bacteroidales bacterium]
MKVKNKKQFYKEVLNILKKSIPEPKTELLFQNDFQLLVAVVLSAQCTDDRVNKITKVLFEKYSDAYSLNNAKEEDIYNVIKSCSYPNSKVKYIKGIAKKIVEEYNGKVPSEYEELIKLPGVGRKTANVVMSVLFDKPVIAVDTHIYRVSKRIGLVDKSYNILQVEKELTKYIERNERKNAHHYLLLHGRYVCKALKPLCKQCVLRHLCKYENKNFD